MIATRPDIRTWIRRTVLLANLLALLFGLVLVVVGTLLAEQSVLPTLMGLFGGAFVSAAVVALVLGRLTVSETTEQVDSALLRGLQDVLEPIRDPVFAGSLSAYRWDCYLACPPPGDPHPDYAYQCMRFSYRVDTLPNEMRIMCAATRDDRALEGFKADDYILRWLVDDDLDPSEPTTFNVGAVRVDREPVRVRAGGSPFPVEGGQAVTLSYPVPRWARQTTGHLVQFQISTRKHVGRETRLRLQAQLFRTVTDAEYRLAVDPGLNVTRLWPSASEVSALGVAQGGAIESTFATPFGNRSAIIHLPFPLQPGSTVAFLMERTPATGV